MKTHQIFTLLTAVCLSLVVVACQPVTVSQTTTVETTEQDATTEDGTTEDSTTESSDIRGTVRLSRANWDTGYFQAAIYESLLTELGYDVVQTGDLAPELFYNALADGLDTDLWANGWFPIHNTFIENENVAGRVTPVGYQVKAGALQGYLIDKATAEKHGIVSIEDMKKPEISVFFDKDGDGKADLTGCNAGWGCEAVIEGHLDAFDLRDSINHVQGEYSLLMADVIARYERGEPIFFYTWTPNWTVSQLALGEDIVWITVPETEDVPAAEGVFGCTEDPCSMGFTANDIRAVANTEWLAANPVAAALVEAIEIPLEDIAAQNQLMIDGEDSDEAILGHATTWIENNREQVDGWLEAALSAE